MPWAQTVAGVALRVPGVLLLDLLYRWDVSSLTEQLQARNQGVLGRHRHLLWNAYYLGHLVSVVLLTLPLQHLVRLYLYMLTATLLYTGHQSSRNYVLREMEYGYEGAVHKDTAALQRLLTTLAGQLLICSLCTFFMKTRQLWLFSAHLLPLLARVCMVPLSTLLFFNKLAFVFSSLEVILFLTSNMFVPYHLAKAGYREVMQEVELFGFLSLGLTLWNRFVIPSLLTAFWLVLFATQLYFYLSSQNSSHEGLVFIFLTSVAECCATPYSLVGLTFTVSRLSLGLLALCKFYLQGFSAFVNENLMHRGVTEGITFLLLALQTELMVLQVLQRTFLLSIILFIIVASVLQSMLEITDPIVLALGASRNRTFWKHFRAVTMCLFLLLFPSYMAFKISHFFQMDFWLLIIVSSSALTALQVTGTFFIYILFMTEDWRQDTAESMDDVIYFVNSGCCVLEFAVAVCVVGYGAAESLWGEWSWMGASVIVVHSYFNVWLRARSGWRSFLLRREATWKISTLPLATPRQLTQHADVCAICYQELRSAIITKCGHYYHSSCLRKWLYVQKTCPMCHQLIKPTDPGQGPGLGDPQQNGDGRQPEAPAPAELGGEAGGLAERPRPQTGPEEPGPGDGGEACGLIADDPCDETRDSLRKAAGTLERDGEGERNGRMQGAAFPSVAEQQAVGASLGLEPEPRENRDRDAEPSTQARSSQHGVNPVPDEPEESQERPHLAGRPGLSEAIPDSKDSCSQER